MKIAFYTTALTLAVLSATGFADDSASKTAAAAVANAQKGQTATFDSNGNLVTNRDGSAKTSVQSGTTMNGQLQYFQGMTGVQGVSQQGNPAKGSSVGATATASGYADFSCRNKDTQRAVASQMVRFGGCDLAGNAIHSVYLQICSNTATGGSCAADTDYSKKQAYAPNVYHTINGQSVGIGCDANTLTCRISLSSSFSFAGSKNSLQTQGQAVDTNNGDSSIKNTLVNTTTSQAFNEAYHNQGSAMAACANQTSANAGKGSVTTCDGSQTSTVGTAGPSNSSGSTGTAAPSKAECSAPRACVRTATQSASYTQSCTRSFPVTNYKCDYTIPTFDCTITQLADGTKTSSCAVADISSGVLINSTESAKTCQAYGAKPANGGAAPCVKWQWTEQTAVPGNMVQAGTCSAYPYPLAGAFNASTCATADSEAQYSCAPDGWYGRTLTADQCYTTDSTGTTQYDYRTKAGCGICVKPIVGYSCYAAPTTNEPADTCNSIDTTACTLTGTVPSHQSGGLTLAQTETYQCSKQNQSCLEYAPAPAGCGAVDYTHGTDTMHKPDTRNGDTFNKAMIAMATMDSISQSSKDNQSLTVPRIFDGKDARCRRPRGFITENLSNNCCRTGLERPGGDRPMNECSMDEVKLADARRTHFTVYIGDYCSKKTGWGPFKTCVQTTETYCSFQGLLPRLVQEQGRVQLSQLANSSGGASLQTGNLAFSYYAGAGQWTPATTINGVSVAAWQYPAYCANSQDAQKALAANPNGVECPSALVQWFATCDNPNGCGDLPALPEMGGTGGWAVVSVDPLQKVTAAISRYAVATGACDTSKASCAYALSAWPAGIGGKAVVTKDVAFPLFGESTSSGSSVPAALSAVGDYMFRPRSASGAAGTTVLPASVTMDFSKDGGQSWMSISLPTTISGEITLPSTDVKVVGGCKSETNQCEYRMTGTASVTAKPWGGAQSPDCTGFTVGQLAVLDFSKMDLSEWLASIMGKVQAPNGAMLAQTAATRAQDMNNIYQHGGQVTSSSGSSNSTATVTPKQEYGPFDATVYVQANYPMVYSDNNKNTDPVSAVTVDWGDCTGPQAVTARTVTGNAGQSGTTFYGTHRYASPDKVSKSCNGGEHNIEHTVNITITSKSGVHYTSAKVWNIWKNYQNTVGVNEGRGGNTANTITVNVAPAPTR